MAENAAYIVEWYEGLASRKVYIVMSDGSEKDYDLTDYTQHQTAMNLLNEYRMRCAEGAYDNG